MRITTSVVLVAATAVVFATGCKRTGRAPSNTEMIDDIAGGEHYSDDMETTEEHPDHDDQGASISPREQALIDDTIREVYTTDFERCAERDMDALENRWIGGNFLVEFTIETSGKVSAAKVLEMDIRERKTKNDKGQLVETGGAPPREATLFPKCIETVLLEWEFDPPPEVKYTHTYRGQVGEAW
jgi:hypothetical protein